MNDEQLNETISPEAQETIFKQAILGHHQTIMAELQSLIGALKERPEEITKDHVVFVKNVARAQVEFLRAHGINAWVDVIEAAGLDVEAGDRL